MWLTETLPCIAEGITHHPSFLLSIITTFCNDKCDCFATFCQVSGSKITTFRRLNQIYLSISAFSSFRFADFYIERLETWTRITMNARELTWIIYEHRKTRKALKHELTWMFTNWHELKWTSKNTKSTKTRITMNVHELTWVKMNI